MACSGGYRKPIHASNPIADRFGVAVAPAETAEAVVPLP